MLHARVDDDELARLELDLLAADEDLADAVGAVDHLFGVVGMEPGVPARLEDVVRHGTRGGALGGRDGKDGDEALRRVVVLPDLDGGWAFGLLLHRIGQLLERLELESFFRHRGNRRERCCATTSV